MASCGYCDATILFGGVKMRGKVYCNEHCREADVTNEITATIPESHLEQALAEFREAPCPVCGSRGPVDMHTSYRVLSFIVLTQHAEIPRVSCRSCAGNAKIKDGLITFLFGWWGVPFGIVLTPVFLCRNIYGFLFPVSELEPSPQFREHVRLWIAQTGWQPESDSDQSAF